MSLRDDPRKQIKYLKYIGTAMVSGGAFFTLVFPTLLTTIMGSIMVVKEGSFFTSMWAAPPIGIPVKTFLFSVENPDEFKLGGKIKLKQMGPYVFE
jgi:hypothetical protein